VTALELLRELRAAGIRVGVDGRGLCCRGRMSLELQAGVRAFKDELAALVGDPFYAAVREIEFWSEDVKRLVEHRIDDLVAAGRQPDDALVAAHEELREAAPSPAPATALAARLSLTLEEFAQICRTVINRPAPSRREEDFRVAAALLRGGARP
jgi:hypothetical protein